MGVEPKIGGKPPKWMVSNGKPYFLMDDLGVPLFLETPISLLRPCISSFFIGTWHQRGSDSDDAMLSFLEIVCDSYFPLRRKVCHAKFGGFQKKWFDEPGVCT